MRKITSPQGANANRNGMRAEKVVLEGIIRCGYIPYRYKEWLAAGQLRQSVVLNHPYQNIYGKRGRMEFYLPDMDTRIEVRSQIMYGSVSEKYPYLLENLRLKTHPKRIVLVALEKALTDDIEMWLMGEMEDLLATGRELRVYRTTRDFLGWLRTAGRANRFGVSSNFIPKAGLA